VYTSYKAVLSILDRTMSLFPRVLYYVCIYSIVIRKSRCVRKTVRLTSVFMSKATCLNLVVFLRGRTAARRRKRAMCVPRGARRQRLYGVPVGGQRFVVRRLQPSRSTSARPHQAAAPPPSTTTLLPVHQDRLSVRRRLEPSAGWHGDRRFRGPSKGGLVLVDRVASKDCLSAAVTDSELIQSSRHRVILPADDIKLYIARQLAQCHRIKKPYMNFFGPVFPSLPLFP